jgi:hypothetical protein
LLVKAFNHVRLKPIAADAVACITALVQDTTTGNKVLTAGIAAPPNQSYRQWNPSMKAHTNYEASMNRSRQAPSVQTFYGE